MVWEDFTYPKVACLGAIVAAAAAVVVSSSLRDVPVAKRRSSCLEATIPAGILRGKPGTEKTRYSRASGLLLLYEGRKEERKGRRWWQMLEVIKLELFVTGLSA